MALADSQKISRVLTGKPFGDGSDGAYSSATIPTMVNESCSGASGGTTLTAGGTGIADNDIVLIHQTRGTGAGNWEVNKIASGGGSVNLVTSENLANTYTDSGSSQAQVTVIKQYTDVTVEAGTWTVPAWAGDQGGILAFAAKGTTTITGSVLATGKGFRGGAAQATGESSTGASIGSQSAANGSGGGGGNGGDGNYPGCGGGGGGHAASGTTGGMPSSVSGTPVPGVGGGTDGNAELTDIVFGGGGGGGRYGFSGVGGPGGAAGGGVWIFAKTIAEITGSIVANGNQGSAGVSDGGAGGGGAGGAVTIQCETATLGTSKITVAAGATQTGGDGTGGAGSVGRIAVHHSDTVTGTTSPTFSDTTDDTLVEAASGGAFLLSQFV